jgi:tyrosine-protein kinase Etk/Wzc
MTEQVLYSKQAAAPLNDAPSWEAPDDRDEVVLIDVLTQLAYRKWLIARVTGIAMLVGVTMCLVLPVRYTATTKIMPPQQTQSTASMMMNQLANIGAGSLAAVAGAGLGLKNPNDIYVGLLNSRPIADAIIRQFGLARVYRAKDMTAARKRLAHYTTVVSEKNGFIAVSVTDKDKQRVAEMANAYTGELRILTKTLAVTEASQRRLFYEDQLKQAKEALLVAEESFQQVQQVKGLVQLDAQAKAMIESLALLRAQVAAKEVEVQALRSYSTEHNPEVELAQGELASLRGEAARLEQRNHSSGFADLGLGDVPGAGMEYLRAEHELKYRQAMFDLLIKQYDAARLDEAKDAAIIQVVEPAIEPDRRSSPKRALIVIAFTTLGFLGGCMLAMIMWWKELMQFDPVAAKRIEKLRFALTGRETAKA